MDSIKPAGVLRMLAMRNASAIVQYLVPMLGAPDDSAQ
jgi:hypothetical protein